MARVICRSYGVSAFKKTRQPRADARGYQYIAPNGAKLVPSIGAYHLAYNIRLKRWFCAVSFFPKTT